jgi:neutral ceramidase
MRARILTVLLGLILAISGNLAAADAKADVAAIKVGIAVRDITPEGPIWLSGYSARNHASEKVDQPLKAQALYFEDGAGERFVLVAFDNCEVSREFMAPVLEAIEKKWKLPQDAVIAVPSHTHSAPCLDTVLPAMFNFSGVEKERVTAYSERLRGILVEIVGAAMADAKPALLAQGKGKANLAMNRRIYNDDRVDFGENPVGPADRDVPVLKITTPEGGPRAVLFGYACHGTSIAGDDFYIVSGDYMAYAREHIEAAFPGAQAVYIQGCGADSNPSPRGKLQFAKQSGLELAGAVAGVLNRPMEPVRGPIRRAFARIDLPLAPSPTREKLLADSQSKDIYVQMRANIWLSMLDSGKELPRSVSYPMSVVRLGNDLTFVILAGEVVSDYAIRIKHELADEHPWTVGYAIEISCYIPSVRILKEGGYEADSSLIYYGIYGPLLGRTEAMILDKVREMVKSLKS